MCSPNPIAAVAEGGLPVHHLVRDIRATQRSYPAPARRSFSEKTPPDMYADSARPRSSAVMIHAIWCTMFSVTLPPENSQNNRQLMNLSHRTRAPAVHPETPSSSRSADCSRRDRPHPLSLPMRRVAAHPRFHLRHLADLPVLDPTRASFSAPELSCCNPICTTCFDFFAAFRHSSASEITTSSSSRNTDPFPPASASTKYFVCMCKRGGD